MRTPPLRRKVVPPLLLGIVLITPWAAAAGPRADEVAAPAFSSFFGSLWNILASGWDDRGCHIDPNGGCTSVTNTDPPALETDRGCHIDPSGACRNASAWSDEGCHIDPSGACQAAGETGCHIDPNGTCRS